MSNREATNSAGTNPVVKEIIGISKPRRLGRQVEGLYFDCDIYVTMSCGRVGHKCQFVSLEPPENDPDLNSGEWLSHSSLVKTTAISNRGAARPNPHVFGKRTQ
jgi:hypothetical protein